MVKEGIRKTDQNAVAIKIVAKENTNAREMYSELEVQAKLAHENVVRFFELFDEPDGFYVVMELYVYSLRAAAHFFQDYWW